MKVFPYILVAVVCAIVVPCLVTFCVNGKQGDGTVSLERISTGRDVLVQTKAGNELVDVEKYVAHIMPGIVDASADDSYLQAQAGAAWEEGGFFWGRASDEGVLCDGRRDRNTGVRSGISILYGRRLYRKMGQGELQIRQGAL